MVVMQLVFQQQQSPVPENFLFSNSVLISLSTVAVITNLNEPEDEAQLVEHDF